MGSMREVVDEGSYFSLVRYPTAGGWIYIFRDKGHNEDSNVAVSMVFVPVEAVIRSRVDGEHVFPTDSQLYKTKVKDLEVSRRLERALVNDGFETLGQVIDAGRERIKQVPNLGRRCLNELNDLLSSLGLSRLR